MRKRKVGKKFGRTTAQRRALVVGIAAELFRHGRIRTTAARAKEVRSFAERSITTAKAGNLSARRRLERTFSGSIAKTLMVDIAPRFASRQGGYTRIVKLSPRQGDRAPRVIIELVS